ncbi:MAG TPA: hypothetical protein ENI57_05705 [Ignavibacteria bacterium]|nr:hypothetical protein [Ignavibacteria bacterium]
MDHKKFLIVLFLSFLIISCNNSTEPEPTINSPINNNFYPVALNHEWEYSTTDKIEYYDTLGNIKNTEVLNLGNTIVRIEALKDNLGNSYKNLIRFESFKVTQPNQKDKTWFEKKDDGLYIVAFQHVSTSQTTIRKINRGGKYMNMDVLKRINLFLDFNLYNKTRNNLILIWGRTRKVLNYPIEVGNYWNDYNIPFYKNRSVETKEKININGNIYTVYKIGAFGDDIDFELNDYISIKYGLVMREVLADSVAILAPNSDDILGFAKMRRISKLVRRNF